jgi:hypothetical protein
LLCGSRLNVLDRTPARDACSPRLAGARATDRAAPPSGVPDPGVPPDFPPGPPLPGSAPPLCDIPRTPPLPGDDPSPPLLGAHAAPPPLPLARTPSERWPCSSGDFRRGAARPPGPPAGEGLSTVGARAGGLGLEGGGGEGVRMCAGRSWCS